ncbi:MAG: type II secretion system protein [Clostridium sp.]
MRKIKDGFTLVEVLLAVAILGMVIAIIYPFMTTSNDLNRRAKDIDVANNFATNKMETFKSNPLGFWKNHTESPISSTHWKYDKNDVLITDANSKDVAYDKYSFGDGNNDRKSDSWYYFDNDFKRLDISKKNEAIYKVNMWGYKKQFPQKTNYLLPEGSIKIKPMDLNEKHYYFESYKLPGEFTADTNPDDDVGEPYDLGIVLGKDAKWVEDFLFIKGDGPSNTTKITSETGSVTTSYKEMTNKYSKEHSGNDHQYYYTMRNEGYPWFMHRFFRSPAYLAKVSGFPDLMVNNFNYDYDTPATSNRAVSIVLDISKANLDNTIKIDFANRLNNPIELYMVFNSKIFSTTNSAETLRKMKDNIKLNVLDNDVNITFLTDESKLSEEYELIMDVYRLDKRSNSEKKLKTYNSKVLN